MIPDRARAVLTGAQLEVVEQIEGRRGVSGLQYDVMTGVVTVRYGSGQRVLVPADGLSVAAAMALGCELGRPGGNGSR